MQASKVDVSKKTLEMGLLRGKKKRLLREAVIKEYIRNRPGVPIGIAELQYAAHIPSHQSAGAFIKRMVRDNKLRAIHTPGKRKLTYEVVEVEPTATVTEVVAKQVDVDIKQAAMRWAWDNDSDSLRGFINSL